MEQIIENKIREIFPQLLKDNLMSFSNQTVPPHKHNAVDSPQLKSADLIPYQIFDVTTINNLTEQAPNGTIGLFDYSNNTTNPALSLRSWGILLRLSNFWNTFNIADFYLDVGKVTSQVIANGVTATVVYDQIYNQLGGDFDTATGIFSTTLPPLPPPNNNLILESWYMVTACVGIIPTTATGNLAMIIVVDGVDRNSVVFFNRGTTFSATISCLLEVPIESDIKIQIINNTGGNISTAVGQVVTWFKIKQIPGQVI